MTKNLTTVRSLWYDDFGFCGCGDPEKSLAFLRDVLRAVGDFYACRAPGNSDENRRLRGRMHGLLPLDSPLALTYRYWLDANGLTEHGGAIVGSWLTDRGEAVLALLEGTADLRAAMDEEGQPR